MKRTIAIDEYNLALQRGTGVVTYAKSFAENICGAKCENGVVDRRGVDIGGHSETC